MTSQTRQIMAGSKYTKRHLLYTETSTNYLFARPWLDKGVYKSLFTIYFMNYISIHFEKKQELEVNYQK